MSDSELDNIPPASWYDEEPIFQYISSNDDKNLDIIEGTIVNSPVVNNTTMAL